MLEILTNLEIRNTWKWPPSEKPRVVSLNLRYKNLFISWQLLPLSINKSIVYCIPNKTKRRMVLKRAVTDTSFFFHYSFRNFSHNFPSSGLLKSILSPLSSHGSICTSNIVENFFFLISWWIHEAVDDPSMCLMSTWTSFREFLVMFIASDFVFSFLLSISWFDFAFPDISDEFLRLGLTEIFLSKLLYNFKKTQQMLNFWIKSLRYFFLNCATFPLLSFFPSLFNCVRVEKILFLLHS